MFAFFFFPCRFPFGTGAMVSGSGSGGAAALEYDGPAVAAACRRALNEEINSTAWGESPRRFPRCSAASGLERVEA